MTRPAYRTIAADLTELITSGQLQPGDRLPSEPELMGRYDVSRRTVRDAIALLRADGLVEVVSGRGVFVLQRGPTEVVRLSPDWQISARPATAQERARWGMPEGWPVLVVVRGDQATVYPGDRTVLVL